MVLVGHLLFERLQGAGVDRRRRADLRRRSGGVCGGLRLRAQWPTHQGLLHPQDPEGPRHREAGSRATSRTGERVAIVDDVATTGGSTLTAVERARAEGLEVVKAVVLVDRQEGGLENIRRTGERCERQSSTRDELLERGGDPKE
ncbi:MAG: hypothetical protein MZV70_41950 [Desulfobacterales bacterium]|nr:hypothetical protein [Desulfobacterales bacterium]